MFPYCLNNSLAKLIRVFTDTFQQHFLYVSEKMDFSPPNLVVFSTHIKFEYYLQ